jgi:hypothetical protein
MQSKVRSLSILALLLCWLGVAKHGLTACGVGTQFGFQGKNACVDSCVQLANNKQDFINVLMSQGIAVQSMIMEGLVCHV